MKVGSVLTMLRSPKRPYPRRRRGGGAPVRGGGVRVARWRGTEAGAIEVVPPYDALFPEAAVLLPGRDGYASATGRGGVPGFREASAAAAHSVPSVAGRRSKSPVRRGGSSWHGMLQACPPNVSH
ncbi:hypothetical protein Airi02_079760 [Actinoallomurus iriomotensis]|uniref:Uncharacterized protein n=1 Tax=Actinoallomurus iriomotensis TaxID=478107 RepID=A0A9W6SCE8_9ACTN|nr:hypothetical protein Airi02_079760 [Actinoallomurus iriomotensis]